MNLKNAHFGSKLKELAFRILRLAGVFAVIYISMVFYLALTERQRAFPRAITHKEANTAIQDKAKNITCTLEDGLVLNGWRIGNENDPILLYFPDADEDAAQFLAEIEEISGIQLAAFNYRGSGENKGKPSQETFENDGKQIFECSSQINGIPPVVLTGRGTGSILAVQQTTQNASAKNAQLLLIDPLFSIADAVSQKYRKLYPRFLVRTDVSVSQDSLKFIQNTVKVIIDRKQNEYRISDKIRRSKNVTIISRDERSLKETIIQSLILSGLQSNSTLTK